MNGTEPIRATVQALESTEATLAIEPEASRGNSQTLTVPRSSLPANVQEGDSVVVELLTEEAAAQHRDATARKLLEDILNGQ